MYNIVNMVIRLKDIEFIVNHKTFESFILDLELKGIDYKKLNKKDKEQFMLAMSDIRCYMLENLKKYNMSWKDFKDYASKYFDEYKENVDNPNDKKYVLVWQEQE